MRECGPTPEQMLRMVAYTLEIGYLQNPFLVCEFDVGRYAVERMMGAGFRVEDFEEDDAFLSLRSSEISLHPRWPEENNMKHLFGLLRTRYQRVNTTHHDPASRVPALPPQLEKLRKTAIKALKSFRGGRLRPPISGLDQVTEEALFTMMQAMADPQKTVAVYFAMGEAMARNDGRPLSDHEMAEAEGLCRAFGQARLTDEERMAVEHLAQNGIGWPIPRSPPAPK